MNTLHLRTFLWLRWRLFINQMKRSGVANSIILGILAVAACLGMIASFIGAVAAGVFLLPLASPSVQLLIWDGVVVMFLFAWTIGLLNELQRSEALTLEKFLHLPVSLAGVFVLNYLSSFMSLTLMFAAPILLGSPRQRLGIGPMMLAASAVGFLFAVTALSYQFQGWLASLMANKRRRRTIIVVVTLAFILICQLPNAINLYLQPWNVGNDENSPQTKKDDPKVVNEIKRSRTEWLRMWETVQESAWFVNVALPPGWLALGGATAAEGNVLPAILGTFAYTMIGVGSLWRAYRTILRLYTGEFTAVKATKDGTPKETPAVAPSPAGDASSIRAGPARTFLDKSPPWIPEQAAVIALATFRGLLRAPEAKMILLSPIIMFVVFGGIFIRGDMTAPPIAVPFLTTGHGAHPVHHDAAHGQSIRLRSPGFRIFVLSPARARDLDGQKPRWRRLCLRALRTNQLCIAVLHAPTHRSFSALPAQFCRCFSSLHA